MLQLFALNALTFSPRAGSRLVVGPALRSSRPVMREACKDTVCYALSNAKPETAEKLGPTQLQQQIDLLQRQITIDKAQLAGESAPEIAISDAGCKDNVCWALSNAKPGSAAKLPTDQLQEQLGLLEQRLEIDQAKLQNRPAVAAAPKPSPTVAAPEPAPTVVAAPEPPPTVVAVPEPPPTVVAVPEPPPPSFPSFFSSPEPPAVVVAPEAAAPEPVQEAAKAATNFFESFSQSAPAVNLPSGYLDAAPAMKSEVAAAMASPAAEVVAGGGVPWAAFAFVLTVRRPRA